MRLEGLGHLKIPMTISGSEPAAFRLEAQRLTNRTAAFPLHYSQRNPNVSLLHGHHCTRSTVIIMGRELSAQYIRWR
jgi:hypothetical protein